MWSLGVTRSGAPDIQYGVTQVSQGVCASFIRYVQWGIRFNSGGTIHLLVNVYLDDMVIPALTTLIGNRDNDVPKEGDLQDVPLHSSDNQDPRRVFDPTPKGKQLPATVAELMHEWGVGVT